VQASVVQEVHPETHAAEQDMFLLQGRDRFAHGGRTPFVMREKIKGNEENKVNSDWLSAWPFATVTEQSEESLFSFPSSQQRDTTQEEWLFS
jgi:hypothetical protein